MSHITKSFQFMRNTWKTLLILLAFGLFALTSHASEQELLKKIEESRKSDNLLKLTENINKLGYLYWDQGLHEKAIEMFEASIVENQKIDNKNAIMNLYTNIGMLYTEKAQFESALVYFRKSLAIREEFNEKQSIASELINISTSLQSLERYFESIENCEKALELAKTVNNLKLIRRCYGVLAENYEKMGDAKKSMEYFTLFATFQKHIQNEQVKNSIKAAEEKIEEVKTVSEEKVKKAETEKQEKEKQLVKTEENLQRTAKTLVASQELARLQEQEIEKKKAEIQHKNFVNTVIGAGLAIALIMALIVFRSYTQKKKTNKLLSEQNDEILKQQEIIKKKNADITKSINYAQKIQKAMLPSQKSLNMYLDDAFIFFKPRDIVSGDFYWFTPVKATKSLDNPDQEMINSDFLISAIDCTGHGVPGAFMSMIGFNLLDEIVNKGITSPHAILDQLHVGIKRSLKQDETENKDGMDMALCRINKKEKIIQFSGAKNPLITIVNGELSEHKGSKYPIGGNLEQGRTPFELTEIRYDEPTMCYIYSDGYQDQFGGSKGLKFMSKKFKRLLVEISTLPIETQKEKLDSELKEWKGNQFKQVDDILIIGFRLS